MNERKTEENLEEPTGGVEPLNVKGGFVEPKSWIATVIFKDFAIKVAIIAATSVSIWDEAADKAVQIAVKYGASIVTAPGKKL